MIRRLLAVVSLLAVGVVPAAGAPACALHSGRVVVLKSSDIDPNVFVWDARARVVAYASGRWRDAADVMRHTVLADPGTRARVVHCDKSLVHSRFANRVFDAIGIRILSGPNRGRFGWVSSEDVQDAAVSVRLPL